MVAIIDGRDKARLAQYEADRAIAYEQAVLIHFAVCAPKKMPKYEPLKSQQREIPQAVQTEMVRAWFMSKVS